MSSIENISLYIPHVFANISANRIASSFEKYIGKVSRVDLVPKIDRTGKHYNAAYVHFNYWYYNYAAYNFQTRVLSPEVSAKFVYDDPWFWIVLENKATKHVSGERKQRINLTDFAEKVEAPDQDYYEQKAYIPDYDHPTILRTREYARECIEHSKQTLDEIFEDEDANYPLSRKEIAICNSCECAMDHYSDWLKKPVPRIYYDDELEQILDEMDDLEHDIELDEEEQQRLEDEEEALMYAKFRRANRQQDIERFQHRLSTLKQQMEAQQKENTL
jgi:hypothetical protein